MGLRHGADDYVVKPFSPGRAGGARRRGAAPGLAADRSRRLSRSSTARCGSIRRAAPSSLDGEELSLTQREFDLLAYLAAHPGRVFSRDQLMDAVWDYPFFTDTSTVTVHVRRLRAKLGDDPSAAALHRDGVGRRLQAAAMILNPTAPARSAVIAIAAFLAGAAAVDGAARMGSGQIVLVAPGDSRWGACRRAGDAAGRRGALAARGRGCAPPARRRRLARPAHAARLAAAAGRVDRRRRRRRGRRAIATWGRSAPTSARSAR